MNPTRSPLHPVWHCARGALLAALLVAAPASFAQLAETAQQRENKIKAALIFKLVKFVDWPAGTFSGKDAVQICALGESGVGTLLAAIHGKPVRDRSAQFHAINSLNSGEARSCHVLWIPAGSRELAGGLPASLRLRGVLTVSDAADFTRRGGIIGLARQENRIVFEISLRAARENGLEPGAPLLELATAID